jgi:ATPase subunit of ABC transporter with duplicated ATPase domains
MISLSAVSLALGARVLFDDVSLTLKSGERYAVVGPNGAGKSTFLQLLEGEEESTLGEIAWSKGSRIGSLKQDQHKFDLESILDVVLRGKKELWQALQAKEAIFENWDDDAVEKLAKLEDKIAQLDGYSAEALAEKLLVGLGVPLEKHRAPLACLSGGYKLRVLLARALFGEPEILLLDEPTNYLDIVSIKWLEEYLKREFQGLLVFVSHDHAFLDSLATEVLDIDYGQVRRYVGNYTAFLKQKEQATEQLLKERASKEAYAAKMQAFIDRFRAKASKAKQAQSKEKLLDKIEWPEVQPSSRRAPHFTFPQERRAGQQILKAKGLSKSFNSRQVLKDVGLEVLRGEKVGFTGPNGVGKSTLLKLLTGTIEPDAGEVLWGHAAHYEIFSQEIEHHFPESQKILEWLEGECPGETEEQLRRRLGSMLFTADDMGKDVQKLSGGEKARLVLLKIAIKKPNILILDEPTNHLDIESREALAKALQAYQGTVLVVSHDRYFLDLVSSRIVALTI